MYQIHGIVTDMGIPFILARRSLVGRREDHRIKRNVAAALTGLQSLEIWGVSARQAIKAHRSNKYHAILRLRAVSRSYREGPSVIASDPSVLRYLSFSANSSGSSAEALIHSNPASLPNVEVNVVMCTYTNLAHHCLI